MSAKGNKVSKLRMAAGVAAATIGMSVVGAAAAPVANAYPWTPWSGPFHPARHYAADVLHPIWSFTHPFRALIP